ncbi:MAG: hypothetical protein GC190_16085 [Alphaproteobacteria bacterium]|nr:hypothetical protein [Alphaproteobacteria bacterium]
MSDAASTVAPAPTRRRIGMLWLVRVLLVLAGIVSIPIILVVQELIGQWWPATSDWAIFIIGAMALFVLGSIMTAMENAKNKYAPDKPIETFAGLIFPLGIMIANPKGTASPDFSAVEHAFGIENGAFVLGFRSHGTGGRQVGVIPVEERIPFENLRHIAVKVHSDDSIQNTAAGGVALDGVTNAIGRVKMRTKAIGALLVLFVETEVEKIEQYVFAIPADISSDTIRSLSLSVTGKATGQAEGVEGDGAGGALDAAETCRTIIDVLQTGDLAELLPSNEIGLSDVAGFIGRLAQASQLTGANASLAAALMAAAMRRFAPHATVSRHEGE